MEAQLINQLNDAINATLAFYRISKEQAANKRTELDFSNLPSPMKDIYECLGDMLEKSIAVGGYGPFRAGCFDLEYPFVDCELGLMIMTDSQNGPMFCISPDKTKIECVGHGPDYYWSAPIEKFLTEWLVDDWKYRLRWELTFPNYENNNIAFEKLKPQMTKLFVADIMSNCSFYLLGNEILVIHETFGPAKDRTRCEFGAFHKPINLPSGANLNKSQWDNETHSNWINAMRAAT